MKNGIFSFVWKDNMKGKYNILVKQRQFGLAMSQVKMWWQYKVNTEEICSSIEIIF